MNRLELINKLILEKKIDIKVHKEILQIDNSKKVFHNSVIRECEECINALEQIKSELDVLQILTKCIRVSTISYDDNNMSKTSYDYSLETDELTIEEFNVLDNYYKASEVKDE